MHKCDFCAKDNSCNYARRRECITRDHIFFELERTPTGDDAETIARPLVEVGGVSDPERIARHLVRNGIGIVR